MKKNPKKHVFHNRYFLNFDYLNASFIANILSYIIQLYGGKCVNNYIIQLYGGKCVHNYIWLVLTYIIQLYGGKCVNNYIWLILTYNHKIKKLCITSVVFNAS